VCCCTLQQHPHQHHPPLTELWRRVGEQHQQHQQLQQAQRRGRGRVRFRGSFIQRDRSAGSDGGSGYGSGGLSGAGGSGGMLGASLKRLTKLKRGGSLKEF